MNEELARRRREFFQQKSEESEVKIGKINEINSNAIKLTDLPTELIERIFYFLPAKTICKDVHRTCKRLYNTTRTPVFWSSYLKACKNYEPISHRIVESEPWKRAFAFEHEEERWEESQSLLRYRSSHVHFATVDALKVNETRNGARIAISGGRDRQIILWDIKNIADQEADKSTWSKANPTAHSGWVWNLCINEEDDKTVFSCGFDSMLKQWEIVNGGLTPIRELNNRNEALLKCIINDNYLYTSTYTSKILVADTRVGLESQHTIQLNGRHAINCMESRPYSNYLYAVCTQSGNLFCVDKRQMRVAKKCGGFKHCMSVDLDAESLVASWKNGVVKYMNPMSLKIEYVWNCPAPSEMKSVNPLRLSKGAFIYGNSYELLIYTPGRNPRLLAKLPTKEMIISVDYNNGDLVCGMSEGVVLFWPRENQNFPIVDQNVV